MGQPPASLHPSPSPAGPSLGSQQTPPPPPRIPGSQPPVRMTRMAQEEYNSYMQKKLQIAQQAGGPRPASTTAVFAGVSP